MSRRCSTESAQENETKRIFIHTVLCLCCVMFSLDDVTTHMFFNINHIYTYDEYIWELWIYAMVRSFAQRVTTADAIVFGEYIWISTMRLYRYFVSMFLCAIWASNRLGRYDTQTEQEKWQPNCCTIREYIVIYTVVIEKIEKKSFANTILTIFTFYLWILVRLAF